MNLTALLAAISNLTDWVKTGLATKQKTITVATSDPDPGSGSNGDIVFVVDP